MGYIVKRSIGHGTAEHGTAWQIGSTKKTNRFSFKVCMWTLLLWAHAYQNPQTQTQKANAKLSNPPNKKQASSREANDPHDKLPASPHSPLSCTLPLLLVDIAIGSSVGRATLSIVVVGRTVSIGIIVGSIFLKLVVDSVSLTDFVRRLTSVTVVVCVAAWLIAVVVAVALFHCQSRLSVVRSCE